MFLDASAIVAILNNDPGSNELIKLLDNCTKPVMYSPLSRYEAIFSLCRSRTGNKKIMTPEQLELAAAAVDALLKEIGAKSAMIADTIGNAALTAAQTYGRVVGHEADLNMGDCFAYACAKGYRLPLLYKGENFSKTDLA